MPGDPSMPFESFPALPGEPATRFRRSGHRAPSFRPGFVSITSYLPGQIRARGSDPKRVFILARTGFLTAPRPTIAIL